MRNHRTTVAGKAQSEAARAACSLRKMMKGSWQVPPLGDRCDARSVAPNRVGRCRFRGKHRTEISDLFSLSPMAAVEDVWTQADRRRRGGLLYRGLQRKGRTVLLPSAGGGAQPGTHGRHGFRYHRLQTSARRWCDTCESPAVGQLSDGSAVSITPARRAIVWLVVWS